MTFEPKRQPKGTNAGGQFTASANPESTLVLDDVAADGGILNGEVGHATTQTLVFGDDVPTVVTDQKGTRSWYNHGRRHRDDGPAVINSKGDREWWFDNQRHRVDGPAVERANGDREWWVNGKLHRIGGPAIAHSDSERWYENGKLHRVDGPAVREPNGDLSWYDRGQLILTMFAENPSP
jgi:hypothetical protein